MKKLLSICFLSILLGLLSFSTQAQSSCGFLMKNLQPDTITGVVQMTPDGLLPLDHTLGHGVYQFGPESGVNYGGNANVGSTELYELFICNTCGLDPKTRVSLDWILQRQNEAGEWETVNENLSTYVDFDIYTFYNEINTTTGNCNRITWLGGRVPNGFGWCEQEEPIDMFHGVNCNTPTNYPGAFQVPDQHNMGYPYSVLNSLGEAIPAMGMAPIYTEALDYFYLDFFSQTRTLLQLHWKQAGNFRLIMNLRQRVGGTDWNNLTWNENETTDFIGGHQSCCGPVLMSDTLAYPIFDEFSKEVCNQTDYYFGTPIAFTEDGTMYIDNTIPGYLFNVTMPDTNVAFGRFVNAGTGACEMFQVDSIYRFHFFERNTPEVVIFDEHDTLCKCTAFGEDDLLALIGYDSLDMEFTSDHKFQWFYKADGETTPSWHDALPEIDTVVGTYTYVVRQVNTYSNFTEFHSDVIDTIVCEGPAATFYVTFLEMLPPVVPEPANICLEVIDSAFIHSVTAVPDPECANTTRWYVQFNGTSTSEHLTSLLGNLVYTGNTFPIHMLDYVPATNIDKTVRFYAVSYDESRDCESKYFTTYTVYLHQTPELAAVTTPTEIVCPGLKVEMEVEIDNTPDNTDPLYTFHWSGDITTVVVNDEEILPNLPLVHYQTSDENQVGFYQSNPLDTCGTAYETSVYVVDGNGCKSVPVTFHYAVGDTINPTVTPNAVTTYINACELNVSDTGNAAPFTTIAGLESLDIDIDDNCDINLLTVTHTDAWTHVTDTTCEDVIVRTYTIRDHCGNPVVFTHTIIAHDSNAPYFRNVEDPLHLPYVRLFPVEGGNCTFNSPDSMVFINAVAPFVYDDCTDSAYLMNTITFNWENTTESPIGQTNIFREKNHLTVEATIIDKCGNIGKGLVIFIDRPEHIAIEPNSITSTGDLCFGDTATLHFDVTKITDDTLMGPFVPYTYEWVEVNGRPATFTAVNDTTTQVTFNAAGDFTFVMRVTDRNGCVAESEPVEINVRALPQLVINHIVLNGQTEPYCPTYGNLTVEAEVVNPVAGQTVAPDAYTWTGESVNIYSNTNRTWVTIVPEWCDTLYYPTVTVVDDRGCVGTVTDTIEVFANGPEFLGEIADTVVEKNPGCKFYIPDFKALITADLVADDCYTFSQLKYSDAYGTEEREDWYVQTPAAGTELTSASQVVTITVYNPCGKGNSINVNVLKPTDVLTVSINPAADTACQEEVLNIGVDYASEVTNAVGDVTYEWTVDGEDLDAYNADYTAMGAMEPGVYTYEVNVEDEIGCTASATATLNVLFQGADPIVRRWPNTLCERFNGALAVDTAPTGYTYILQNVVYGDTWIKTSDVPEHQTTQWNTIVFDSLRPGVDMYRLTVITNEGCERVHEFYTIDNASASPANPVVAHTDVTVCTNDNGVINITSQSGYTYELYAYDYATATVGELVGTATSYNNLAVGHYMLHTIHNYTHCSNDTLIFVRDAAVRPTPNIVVSKNTNCENEENVYDGKIKLNTTGLYYTVYKVDGEDTTYYMNNELVSTATTITGLQNGVYYLNAFDATTGCSMLHDSVINLGNSLVITTPTLDIAANNYCSEDTANGAIEVTNFNQFAQLYVIAGTDTIRNISDYTSDGFVSLYQGTYTVYGVNNHYCPATKVATVQHVTVDPVVNATMTMNHYCDEDLYDGTVKITRAPGNSAQIVSFTLQNAEYDSTMTFANPTTTATFTGLNGGSYTYYATSKFNCVSDIKTIEVSQYELPAMDLDSTPNHMCAPTFEKPGDGTIRIITPTAENVPGHFFEYKFYDELGNEMTVPYDLPLTHTKYWLAAQRYRVVAYDTVSHCSVEGYITVEDSLYEVDFDYETTTNYACNTVGGTGSITVVNPTSTNPDAAFAYSLDGVTYQTSPTFTGLKDSVYTVYVKDTTMACVKMQNVVVNPTDSCAPVVTITDNLGNTGVQFDYCYGAEGIQLCATAVDTCDGASFTYAWYAPCADPNSSSTSCIDVQTDHYVVNGCDYILTVTNNETGCQYNNVVNVAIHPNPALSFTINGVPASIEHTNTFCETEELHIAVISTEELDTASITWTLGIVGTGFAEFDVKGDTIADDNITYCVRANSKFGCASPIASLPISFIRTVYDTVDITTCNTCTLPDGTVVTPSMDTVFAEDFSGTLADWTVIGAPAYYSNSIYNGAFRFSYTYYPPQYLISPEIPDLTSDNTLKFTYWTQSTYYTERFEVGFSSTTNDISAFTWGETTTSNDYYVHKYYQTTVPAGTKYFAIRSNAYDALYLNIDDIVIGQTNYPYSTSVSHTYTSSLTGCDSIVTYNVTLNTAPQVSPAEFTATEFCEQQELTLADFTNQFTINWNGDTTGAYWMIADPLSYDLTLTPINPNTVITYDFATNNSIYYLAENDCGSDYAEVTFPVSKSPVIVSANVPDPMCAYQSYAFTGVMSTYGTSASLALYLDNELIQTIPSINGLNQTFTFDAVTIPYALDGKQFKLVASNNNDLCDDAVYTKTMNVDTTFIQMTHNTDYCVGDQIKVSDFSGVTPASFTTLTLYVMNGTTPNPASDATITLPYTLTNRVLNGANVYFVGSNTCYTEIISNVVELTVNDKPNVHNIPNKMVCDARFDLPTTDASYPMPVPTVDTNGTPITASGWILQNAAGEYVATTVNEMRTLAYDSMIYLGYYATNGCGSDTSFFSLRVIDVPEITLTVNAQCPTSTLDDVFAFTYDMHVPAWYALLNPADSIFYLQNGTMQHIITPAQYETYTMNDAEADGYNGKDFYVVIRNVCGCDTAHAAIQILTNTHTQPVIKPACEGELLSSFIQTTPEWQGSAPVDTSYWKIITRGIPGGPSSAHHDVNPATYEVHAATDSAVYYVWETECNQTIITNITDLVINQAPVVTVVDQIEVCEGNTISLADATLAVTYEPATTSDQYDTVWTIDGNAFDFSTVLTAADHNGKKLVATITPIEGGEGCAAVSDTIALVVDTLPVPTITGPARACEGDVVSFVAEPATGITNYAFIIGTDTTDQTSNTFNHAFTMSTTGAEVFEVYVEVEDANGCIGKSEEPVSIKITNEAQFIFFNADGTENVEHAYTATTGTGLNYGWMVGTECNAEDKLVYVEYDIYFNDQIISNDAIGQYFQTQISTDLYGNTYPYVSTNTMSWLNGDSSANGNTSLYNYAIANPTTATAGNHFPNTNLGLTNTNVYDDLWMHFLGDRQIDATLVPFRLNGEYKIVYRLYSTSHEDDFNHLYYENNDHMNSYGLDSIMHLGGQNALISGATLTLLATDSITIAVSGENIAPSEATGDEDLPTVAPALNVDEPAITPSMDVWPNPAPAVTTTLKARVYNMNGEATVTLTTLGGKQVYSGDINIDSDSFYFEFGVNNLSVGSYIMTVRTATDVITKKVVVAALAH